MLTVSSVHLLGPAHRCSARPGDRPRRPQVVLRYRSGRCCKKLRECNLRGILHRSSLAYCTKVRKMLTGRASTLRHHTHPASCWATIILPRGRRSPNSFALHMSGSGPPSGFLPSSCAACGGRPLTDGASCATYFCSAGATPAAAILNTNEPRGRAAVRHLTSDGAGSPRDKKLFSSEPVQDAVPCRP